MVNGGGRVKAGIAHGGSDRGKVPCRSRLGV